MKKILVIGSGPIIIGQAAEFDYAGTQACRSLREEGYSVVLINSNPATIMTDAGMADAIYIEPLTVEFCERVIAKERPDGLLATLGGQTGLNLASQLSDHGILEKYNVKLLGTPLEAIRKAEDRELFRALMREIKEPVPESWIVESEDDLKAILDEVPYPCIVRPAYTLGGTGGGIAKDPDELWEIGRKGLKLSMRSQLMVERSLLGWKEIEYEVMRDGKGNCITVCNMENFDPMGVHTGDSIVVAPSQTLSDIEYHMMRTASLKIINALGIEGGCNVQMALHPDSFDYYIIEVNPRVSRSSALASKATGYPIARVAAKIAVGRTLDEIENMVTKTTKACFEPALDYCVVKIPRWPFDKFASGDRRLSTQMKATGEVMAIDRTFESAFMKAIRGLEVKQKDLRHERFQGIGSMAVSAMGSTGVSPVPNTGPIESDPGFSRRHGARLPHWREDQAVYAVSFRLGDSLPKEVWLAWKEQRARMLKTQEAGERLSGQQIAEVSRLYIENVERYLDSGKGKCVLKDPRAAQIVSDSLRHFDRVRYRLHAWCVMPNHVHVIVEPIDGNRLEDIVHSWKSFTSHAINESLGRSGSLWQVEYYDHIVRSEREYALQVEYVLANPSAAGLTAWPWSGVSSSQDEEHGRDAHATHVRDGRATYGGKHEMHGQDGRATDGGKHGFSDADLERAVVVPTDERLWAIAEALRRGWGIERVYGLCRVDRWFLVKIQNLLDIERRLLTCRETAGHSEPLIQVVQEAFDIGFPSPTISALVGANDHADQDFRQRAQETIKRQQTQPVFKMVDTCAGEFESATPYYYGTFEVEDDAAVALS